MFSGINFTRVGPVFFSAGLFLPGREDSFSARLLPPLLLRRMRRGMRRRPQTVKQKHRNFIMYLDDALRQIAEEKTLSFFPLELRQREFQPRPDDLTLDPDLITSYARFGSVDESSVARMLAAVKAAASSEALSVAVRCVFRSVFLMDRFASPWVSFQSVLGDLASPMQLVIASGMVPLVRKWHAEAGIPEEVTRDTCSILGITDRTHRKGKGETGIYYPGPLAWMRHYCNPERLYLHFGRFGFMVQKHSLPVTVYRRRNSPSEFRIFPHEGLRFDSRGFCIDGSPDDPPAAFTSRFRIVNASAEGNAVRPDGSTEETLSRISLSEYELFLGEGTPVLDMHIPAGGSMTPGAAQDSFRRAKEFYSSLPDSEKRPKAVICSSWIFNPNLPEFLPEDSNLVRLLRRVHPVPRSSSPTDGLWFIFLHEGEFKTESAPRDSSLRRAVLDYIASGHRWRTGGMFLPMDEI